MDEVYQLLEEADNVVLASPMYFHSVTGKFKSLIDRFQVYWAGHVRNDMPEKPLRKGAILMVGGAPSFPNQFLGGELVMKNLLNDLSTECLGEVCLPNSRPRLFGDPPGHRPAGGGTGRENEGGPKLNPAITRESK